MASALRLVPRRDAIGLRIRAEEGEGGAAVVAGSVAVEADFPGCVVVSMGGERGDTERGEDSLVGKGTISSHSAVR